MLIHIHGGGFRNRGAQLMLRTAIDRLGELLPDARFCVEQINSDFRDRAGYGLYTIAPRAPYVSPWKTALFFRVGETISKLVPRSEVERYGIVRRADVDALVDISGYAFGDKWPAQKSAAMAKRVQSIRRKGRPVVLLPQMFGPFAKPEVAEAFRPVVREANLLYARDEPSRQCLEPLNSTGREIGLAPDITIFTKPKPAEGQPTGRYACLVPNNKMIEQGAGTWSDTYVQRMAEAARRIESHGVTPRVLIHDGDGVDHALGERLLAELGRPNEPMLIHTDPQVVKGLIAGAELLVGSRFHAIVASLSTGTPAIAMGWAHKYEALMADFGVEDYVQHYDDEVDRLHSMIDRLLAGPESERVRSELATRKESMRQANSQMWTRVADELKASTR